MRALLHFLSGKPYRLPVFLALFLTLFFIWYINSLYQSLIQFTAHEHAKSYTAALSTFQSFYNSYLSENLSQAPDVMLYGDATTTQKASPLQESYVIPSHMQLQSREDNVRIHYIDNELLWASNYTQVDQTEKEAFDFLKSHPYRTFCQTDTLQGKHVFRYFVPLAAPQNCAKCLLLSDLVETPLLKTPMTIKGFLEVILPLDKIKERAKRDVLNIFKVMMLGTLSYLLLLYLALRKLQKSLKENKSLYTKVHKQNTLLEKEVQARTSELVYKNNHLKEVIIALKKTKNQLVLQEKMASIGMLTAGISHEIKNPLNLISNFAKMTAEFGNELKEEMQKIGEKLSEKEKENMTDLTNTILENCKKISNHSQRANSIIQTMLIQSRSSTGEKTLVDINHLLEEYITLAYHGMRAQNSHFNAKIEKHFDETLPKITVSQQNIGRAFLNIINNGLYAAFEKSEEHRSELFMPTLIVTTSQDEKNIIVTIQDNGKGIPKTLRNKIFEPFFTTKPAGKGTGLGLSMCYDTIVIEHGGKIEIDSKPNELTEFTIRLPKKYH